MFLTENHKVPILGLTRIAGYDKAKWLDSMEKRIKYHDNPVGHKAFRSMFFEDVDYCEDGLLLEPIYPVNDHLPVARGVYFCVRSFSPNHFDADDSTEEIVYVGKTNDFKSRFQSHHKKLAFELLGVNEILTISMDERYSESDILWAERQYINLLRPVLNDKSSIVLGLGSSEDTKQIAIENYRQIWDHAFAEGLKLGFNSAKSQMIDFFDSAISMPQ